MNRLEADTLTDAGSGVLPGKGEGFTWKRRGIQSGWSLENNRFDYSYISFVFLFELHSQYEPVISRKKESQNSNISQCIFSHYTNLQIALQYFLFVVA